ncbi:NXPE family member 3-like [Oncorhynchus tshawytscha]|uniref:NXPE C-terminal domain-containing protein n=1 Tax=Oncorhynchus tshawytscha TaxID=74940 RepID=A0A8C8HKC1_ONCTS|nr:NXPE family member 3-like [Oncorhynchus tshawytscha]
MWDCQSKYVCIFLLLALSGLFFLFHNINILEWKLNSTLDLSHIHSEGSPPCLDRKLSFFCSHLVQEPSTEEALEDCSLLQSIAGPEPLPVTTPLDQTSDPAHSLFAILPAGGGRERHVGDQLEALVLMNDFQGCPKSRGGDFLLARLHSPELGAGVAGQVLDHLNGTYSAIFPLLWEGSVWVEVTLVHPSEAVSLLRRFQEERLNWVPSKSLFRSGLLSETTECNLCLPNNQQPLCDYTDPRTGEPWFCYKPKQLACDTRINHFKAGSQTYLQHLTSKEALLFQSGININVHIHATGSDSVTVLPKEKDKPDEESSSVAAAPIRTPPLPSRTPPSGYYYQGSWRALDGVVIRQFNDPAAVIQCLKGKQVYMYGDSTVRQYYDYLTSFVPELKKFNLRSHVRAGPFMAVNIPNNILLKYRCHGPPIFWPPLSVSQLHYVANELDGLAGGSDTVVVISVSTHFSFFPLQAYIRRLRRIRRAVVRLLNRAPGTVVVVRSANLDQRKDNFINSDWILTQLDRVLKAMFRGLDVMLLDTWEMTLAHHLPHDLHPAPPIIKNMINTILSGVCPLSSRT